MNDFLKYHEKFMKRVNVLFIHDFNIMHEHRLFVKVTSMQQKIFSINDECLNLSVLKITSIENYCFVNFSNIQSERLYIMFINTDDKITVRKSRFDDANNRDIL